MNKLQLDAYRSLLGDIKSRVRHAQRRAALSANAEMLLVYWDIGRLIAGRQKAEGWGAGVIPRLAVDLKNELPEQKGFSERNIGYMIRFAREYSSLPILQLAVANSTDEGDAAMPSASGNSSSAAHLDSAMAKDFVSLPWSHHLILLEKLKDMQDRFWYAQQALEQGWSRDTLIQQIKGRVHERQGAAITNFARTLAEPHASIAQQLLKDPYIFDFLTLEEPFDKEEVHTPPELIETHTYLLKESRVIGAIGISTPAIAKRPDSSGFPMSNMYGRTEEVFGKSYDKGHHVYHGAGGGADWNLFPQLRSLNRGWSEEGKLYRQMEAYVAANPGTMFFSRPIHLDGSLCPSLREYGVLMPGRKVWWATFSNVPDVKEQTCGRNKKVPMPPELAGIPNDGRNRKNAADGSAKPSASSLSVMIVSWSKPSRPEPD